jgi:dephospho-CoA kinase
MKILDVVNEGPNDPHIFKAIFLAGGPGSGKSFVSSKLLSGTGLRVVNSDDIYEYMMTKAGMKLDPETIFSPAGQATREKAKAITKRKQSSHIDGRLGLIIDGTGKDVAKYAKTKKMLEDLGYDTMMLFVNTSLDVAQQRNLQRARSLDPNEVAKMWNSVQQNIMSFQQLFGAARFYVVDNSGGLEDPSRKENFGRVEKAISRFINEPAKRREARAWLDAQNSSTVNEAEAKPITDMDLKKLEFYADKIFSNLGIDIEFTRHFLDRANDERNVRQITLPELAVLFRDEYSKWGKKIAQLGPNAEAVMKDMRSDINIPFALNWDPRNQELDLVAKTVMRKKNFKTPNPEFPVESKSSASHSDSNSYLLQLERDSRAGMLILHILNKHTGKRTEVRGKMGYETNGYDPQDKLHQLLDKVGKSASVSDLMNGDVVSINPRHPDGASAKVAADKAYNENAAGSKAMYTKPQFDVEWEEAERYPEFVKIGKAAWIELANKGKAVTIKSAKGINNTDAADADSFKSLDKDKQARALAQLKSGNVEMPIVAVYPDGWKELIGGNTRLTAMLAQDGKATVWVFEVPDEVADLAENFADGKKPGRKGLAKRMGVNTKASVGDLRKTAKNSTGEKQRMAHWLANMKAGKQRASETIVEFDEEDEIYYSKKLAPVAKKLFQTMYPEAKVNTVEDGDGYLSIKTTDGVFRFSIGVSHQYGDNVISVGNAYAGSYKGVVGQLVKAAAELLQKKHPDGETTLVAQHDVSDNYWPQLANKLGINYENNAW